MIIKSLHRLYEMLLLLFLLVWPCLSEWPPKDCDNKVRRLISTMMFTGKDMKRSDTMCRLAEEYEGSVFIDFERRAQKERLKRPDDSHLTFHVNSIEDGRTIVHTEVYDDRIVLEGEETSACQGDFLSENGVRKWIKLRVHSVADVSKTIVSVSIQENGHFTQCASIDVEGTHSSYRINIQGTTTIGMEQWVHVISRVSPEFTQAKTDMKRRMSVVENRLSVLESLVSDQISSHVVRHRALQESHSRMENALILSRSLSHSSVKVHFIFNIAIMIAFVVAIVYYIRMKLLVQIYSLQRREHIL